MTRYQISSPGQATPHAKIIATDTWETIDWPPFLALPYHSYAIRGRWRAVLGRATLLAWPESESNGTKERSLLCVSSFLANHLSTYFWTYIFVVLSIGQKHTFFSVSVIPTVCLYRFLFIDETGLRARPYGPGDLTGSTFLMKIIFLPKLSILTENCGSRTNIQLRSAVRNCVHLCGTKNCIV